MKLSKNINLVLLFSFGYFLLFLSGLKYYSGSSILYILFSFFSLILLAATLYGPRNFGFLFFTIFIWLGTWFKISVNFFLSGEYLFAEPVGKFNGSPQMLDEILKVMTIAFIAILLARLITIKFNYSLSTKVKYNITPFWYERYRFGLWLFFVFSLFFLSIINIHLGIHRVGKAPQTILVWPLNALLAWTLNIGLVLFLSSLLWWEMESKNGKIYPYLFAIEGGMISISLLSRATFLLHVIPFIVAFWLRFNSAKGLFRYNRFIYVTFSLLIFAISLLAVSKIRDGLYKDTLAQPAQPPQLINETKSHNASQPVRNPENGAIVHISSIRLELLNQLFIGRWIGVEGVMAIAAVENKNFDLFKLLLTEKREFGKVPTYESISNSGYQVPDSNYQFGTTPGVIGFLYSTGSIWFVFFGIFIITTFIIYSEEIVFIMTKNPILCAVYGMYLAHTIVQLGMTPRQDIPQYLMIYASIIILWIIQTVSLKNNRVKILT